MENTISNNKENNNETKKNSVKTNNKEAELNELTNDITYSKILTNINKNNESIQEIKSQSLNICLPDIGYDSNSLTNITTLNKNEDDEYYIAETINYENSNLNNNDKLNTEGNVNDSLTNITEPNQGILYEIAGLSRTDTFFINEQNQFADTTNNNNNFSFPMDEFENVNMNEILNDPLENQNANKKFDFDAISKYIPDYTGGAISNGFLSKKVNPIVETDFAYINRSKLVNTRLAIKKQMKSSPGLQAITKSYPNYNKIESEFTLANPIELDYMNMGENAGRASSKKPLIYSGRHYKANPMTPSALYNKNNEMKKNDAFNKNILFDENSINTFKSLTNVNIKDATTCLMSKEATGISNLKESTMDPKSAKTPTNRMSKRKKAKSAKKEENIDEPNLLKSSPIVIIEKKSFKMDKTEEPSPFSYHVPRRPPNEKISPMFTIGKRCFSEKQGGGRTSWEKEWFNSNNPYTIKADYRREVIWPSPNNYRIKSTLGDDANTVLYKQAPMHTIGTRLSYKSQAESDEPCTCNKYQSDLIAELVNTNSLKKFNMSAQHLNKDIHSIHNRLDVMQSVNFIHPSPPKISLSFRENGTELWAKSEETPGPGSYDHSKFVNVFKNRPKYTVAQAQSKVHTILKQNS